MSTVVCVTALVTDRAPDLPTARVALIESAKPGRRVELPGGKAMSGEPPYMAARREMREEIGIEVTNLEPLRTIQGDARPGAEFASDIWVFRARADAERAELVAGDDAKQAFWATRSDVLELERNGCLSDLASKGVLLGWARQVPVATGDDAAPMPTSDRSEHLNEIDRLHAEIADWWKFRLAGLRRVLSRDSADSVAVRCIVAASSGDNSVPGSAAGGSVESGYHPEVDAAIDAVVSASYGVGPSPFERAVVRLLGMLTKHRPAPLTVEEARAWALREVREYSGADSNYPWLALRLETALLAASRGEVPSEVRASTCPTCRGGAMVRAEGYDRDGFPHEEPCPTCCKPEVRAPERPNAFGEALGRMHRPGAIPPEVRAPQTPGPPAGEMAVTVGEELPGFADPVDVPPVLTPEEVRRADKIKRLGETIDSLRAQLRTYDFRGANPVHWRGLLEQLAIAEKALASAPRSEEKGVCLPDKEQPK